MKLSGLLTGVFIVLTIGLLIAIPLTATHEQTSTTVYTNNTQNVTVTAIVPNRIMENIPELDTVQANDQISVPGAFGSSYSTQVNLTTGVSPVAYPRI
jgi:spore coat protein CotF